jgi:glycosyltransferase involved in cell wall biosynthesis
MSVTSDRLMSVRMADDHPISVAGQERPIHVLLIGPRLRTDDGAELPVGGTMVMFEALLAELARRPAVATEVINSTNAAGIWPRMKWAVRTAAKLPLMLWRCDVLALHASFGRAWRFGPLLYLLCKLFRKPWLYRSYGGRTEQLYEALPGVFRWLVRQTLFRTGAVLLETRLQVDYLRQRKLCNAVWFANFREVVGQAPSRPATPAQGATRFVYLGQVRPCKGIRVLIEACKRLDDGLVVDVYGPLMEGMTEAEFGNSKARYRGPIAPADVPAILKDYDALVFPTIHAGEGYPGVILESYAAGLPVITTRWRAIPEIVDETSGILIEPNAPDELLEAIRELSRSPQRLSALSHGASRKVHELSAEVWMPVYVNILKELVSRYRDLAAPTVEAGDK